MDTNRPLLSIAQTLDFLTQQAQQYQPLATEQLSLLAAQGRVLAEDIYSPINVVAFDNSAMDGYAINSADAAVGAVLPVSQRIPAGTVAQPLAPHTAARIFTGAMLPAGADAVVMQENTSLDTSVNPPQVTINVQVPVGEAIRKCGEDIQKGSLLLAKGKKLTPADIGLAASVGCASLTVYKKLRVAVLSSGDELVNAGSVEAKNLQIGKIFNSNYFQLYSILQRWHCVVLETVHLPDDLAQTEQILHQIAERVDLIISTGGVSVGEEDHLKYAVANVGKLDVWRVAIRPGKPFAFGYVQGKRQQVPYLGLPGNPVSAFVTLLILGRSFIFQRQGQTAKILPSYQLTVINGIKKADNKRTEYLRARFTAQHQLEIYPSQSSGVLTSVANSDGFIINPPGNLIQAGDSVEYLPFSQLFANE